LDQLAQQNYNEAMLICFPATPTFDPASLITPTIGGIATTEVPTNTPETPTETLTPTP